MTKHHFSLQALKAHCSSLKPVMAEAHYRRFISRNPQNLNGWALLIQCLKSQHNYVEASFTLDHFLDINGAGDAGKIFAIVSYFQIGEHVKAKLLSLKLADKDLSKNPMLARIASLLSDLTECDVRAGFLPLHDGSVKLGVHDSHIKTLNSTTNGPEVVLLLKYEWHHSIQKGIAAHLSRVGVRFMFLRTVWEVVAARPKVVVVSDALGSDRVALAHYLPNCLIVYTRHGLGDKNFAAHAAGQAHVTCVSSASVAEEFARQCVLNRDRLWVTGFPQMDDLFQRLSKQPESAINRRTVLVAPTFTKHLNAADVLGKDLVDSVRGSDESIHIMIRPHPHSQKTHANLVQAWSDQAVHLPNVSIHSQDELNLMDLFDKADVMVSDVSSAGLAWLATGRPLVCMTDSTKAMQSAFFAPEGLEWRMHKAAVHVPEVETLRRVVRQVLIAPAKPNAYYLALRNHLFGSLTDGRASERVALRIKKWLDATERN